MLTKGFGFLLREYRAHRMARFTAWVLAYGAVLQTVDRFVYSAGGFHTFLWFVFWVCGLIGGIYYLNRLLSYLRSRLLWRLLPRLVVAYILIGVVPISLILALVWLAAVVINGQFATFLVTLRLRQ